MNEPTQAPFAFMPAQPKRTDDLPTPETGQAAPAPKRTRRTKAELAAAQGEKQIDPFDAFDKVYATLDALPKPVRDRIMGTLNRIYG